MCHFVKPDLKRSEKVPPTGRTASWCAQCPAKGEDITSEQDDHTQAHMKTKQNTDTQLATRLEHIKDTGREKNGEGYVQKETL